MVSRAIIAHNQLVTGHSSPFLRDPSTVTCCHSSLITEEILHTGQHFDANMSDIFFNQMGIPKPAVNLNINGGTHGEMTGKMLAAIEAEILYRKPDWVLVYGGTNATLPSAQVVKDDVGRNAEKAGLFVLTQTSDGGAALLNRKGFRPKEFS
jgi:UDP-GlcNAc3NAcA epimerase